MVTCNEPKTSNVRVLNLAILLVHLVLQGTYFEVRILSWVRPSTALRLLLSLLMISHYITYLVRDSS